MFYKPKTLHIIDPDLFEVGGHNIPMDSALVLECIHRQIDVNIYGRIGSNLTIHNLKVNEIFRFGLFILFLF